jgi:hypothetical protein
MERARVRVILDTTASTARFGELKLAPTLGMYAYFVNDHKVAPTFGGDQTFDGTVRPVFTSD